MKDKKFDVVWLLGGGIGNVIQGLYSVEYCLRIGVRVGVYVENIPNSFIEYLQRCYPEIIIEDQTDIDTKILIHSWLVKSEVKVRFENYVYVNPDYESTKQRSEDEHYLDIVKAIYPEGEVKYTLDYLILKVTGEIDNLSEKTIIYPGCLWNSPTKRWPHYDNLIQDIGKKNIVVLGGPDDGNYSVSYVYPKWITNIFKQKNLDRISFWKFLKSLNLLIPYAHLKSLKGENINVFLNYFSWEELVYIFRNANNFIGNDGGLSHLAGASGAKGLVIFGPTSVNKSRPLSKLMKPVKLDYHCQPCFYNVGGVIRSINFINCPYQVKCMSQISSKMVINELYSDNR